MNHYATMRNLLILLGLCVATQAHAYIGPGVGLSAIGTVIAFIAGMLMLIVGFVWYPFKRLYKRLAAKSVEEQATDAEAGDGIDVQSEAIDERRKS